VLDVRPVDGKARGGISRRCRTDQAGARVHVAG
jgi:hypothetical protein